MKFPRHARLFRGQLDAVPFASVFFLLLIFVLLASRSYTPGVRLELPPAEDLPGTDRPAVAVALDKDGQCYFQNQLIRGDELLLRLRAAAASSRDPLTLVVQADREVSEEKLIGLALLARQANIRDLMLATLPRVFTNGSPPDAAGAP
jgi:biopolymer transport protein ExbD